MTVGDAAAADPGLLQANFGRTCAAWLARIAQGEDERPVVVTSEPKSMSRETTFERDLHPRHDRAALSAAFTGFACASRRIFQRKGYVGRTVGIKLRFDDFRTVTRDLTLPSPTADSATIRRPPRMPQARDAGPQAASARRARASTLGDEHQERRPAPVQSELPFGFGRSEARARVHAVDPLRPVRSGIRSGIVRLPRPVRFTKRAASSSARPSPSSQCDEIPVDAQPADDTGRRPRDQRVAIVSSRLWMLVMRTDQRALHELDCIEHGHRREGELPPD